MLIREKSKVELKGFQIPAGFNIVDSDFLSHINDPTLPFTYVPGASLEVDCGNVIYETGVGDWVVIEDGTSCSVVPDVDFQKWYEAV